MHCCDIEPQPASLCVCTESLAFSKGTSSFRKHREEDACGRNTGQSEREVFCCGNEFKTNVLTVMLRLNSVNKESRDKQIWLRGNVG